MGAILNGIFPLHLQKQPNNWKCWSRHIGSLVCGLMIYIGPDCNRNRHHVCAQDVLAQSDDYKQPTNHSSAATNLYFDGLTLMNLWQSWTQRQHSSLPVLFVVSCPLCSFILRFQASGHDIIGFFGTPHCRFTESEQRLRFQTTALGNPFSKVCSFKGLNRPWVCFSTKLGTATEPHRVVRWKEWHLIDITGPIVWYQAVQFAGLVLLSDRWQLWLSTVLWHGLQHQKVELIFTSVALWNLFFFGS